MIHRLISVLLAALLLSACASSGPTISAARSPGIDFTQFETFNYLPRLGTDRSSGARTALSNQLIEAMNHEMSSRGIRLSDTPDLVVDFNFVTRDGIQVRQSPSMSMSSVHRSHWGRSYSVWGSYQTTVRQWTEGSLVIDLLDPRRNMLVAEGGAQKRVSDSVDMAVVEQAVSDIMQAIWAN